MRNTKKKKKKKKGKDSSPNLQCIYWSLHYFSCGYSLVHICWQLFDARRLPFTRHHERNLFCFLKFRTCKAMTLQFFFHQKSMHLSHRFITHYPLTSHFFHNCSSHLERWAFIMKNKLCSLTDFQCTSHWRLQSLLDGPRNRLLPRKDIERLHWRWTLPLWDTQWCSRQKTKFLERLCCRSAGPISLQWWARSRRHARSRRRPWEWFCRGDREKKKKRFFFL